MTCSSSVAMLLGHVESLDKVPKWPLCIRKMFRVLYSSQTSSYDCVAFSCD